MAGIRDVLENVREDDFVEYYLFPSESTDLSDLQRQVEAHSSNESKDYIWQKDEFKVIIRDSKDLPPIIDNEEQLPPHLYGVTHYGENIEDEWFVVHILVQLTKTFPGLIARVVDVDGEFLLIEAADALPKWANPEICEKRVYILNGEVHMIPVQDDDETMTVLEALRIIRSSPDQTKASDRIQKAIETRVKGYPDKIQELLHQTNAYVPAGVAALLKAKPSLIAPAITAFCYRDPIDVRACRAMRYFPPETRIMTQVKMTRCLYAMLLHHKYVPDRRTGWNLPPLNSPKHLAHLIGVKLACGFEILVSQCKKDSDDLENDRGWHRYKQSLSDKGYFKELLEGCLEYKRLETEAKDFYRNHTQYAQKSTGETVLELLNTLEVDVEGMKRESENLPPPDDDSWMEISSDDLDKILNERYGSTGKSSVNEISAHLNSFLGHVSGLEGAEHPRTKDGVPLRPKRGIKKNKESTRDDENNRISMDQEAFTCAVQNILDFKVPEDSWDLESEGSDMSSYEDEVEMDLNRKKGAEGEKSELKQYMDQMDRELQSTTMAHSFKKKQPKGMEDSFSDIESFEPVDIDMNALRNILDSYKAQMGGAGPASNLLGPMGVRFDEE